MGGRREDFIMLAPVIWTSADNMAFLERQGGMTPPCAVRRCVVVNVLRLVRPRHVQCETCALWVDGRFVPNDMVDERTFSFQLQLQFTHYPLVREYAASRTYHRHSSWKSLARQEMGASKEALSHATEVPKWSVKGIQAT